jgi:hypothetical protein
MGYRSRRRKPGKPVNPAGAGDVHEHLISTVAVTRICPCGARTLVALDSGSTARVDSDPLPDRAAELTALIDDRWTYSLIRVGWLVHRDADVIAAGTLDGPVHREHRCPPRQPDLFDHIGAAR